MNGIIDSNQKIVANGLILNLDAAQRRSYPTTGTTWTDLSGSGYNGTLVNGPTFNSANGGSIVFDGVDDRVSFTGNPALSGSWSVGLFFNLSRLTGVQILFGRSAGAPNYEYNYLLYTDADKVLAIQSADGYTRVTSLSIFTNTWYFAVGTFESATKALKLYVNGALVDTKILTVSSTPVTGPQTLNIGNADAPFQGNIAQASLYNIALSATQVSQNYNAVKSRFGL